MLAFSGCQSTMVSVYRRVVLLSRGILCISQYSPMIMVSVSVLRWSLNVILIHTNKRRAVTYPQPAKHKRSEYRQLLPFPSRQQNDERVPYRARSRDGVTIPMTWLMVLVSQHSHGSGAKAMGQGIGAWCLVTDTEQERCYWVRVGYVSGGYPPLPRHQTHPRDT